MSPLKVTFSLVCIVIVIIGAYYATYYIGIKASGQSRGRFRNKNINIVDRFAISRDKSFYIVEIAQKVYVIGVTNQAMTLFDTIDAAAFNEAAAQRRDSATYSGDAANSGGATQSGHAAYGFGPGGALGGGWKNKLTKRLAAFTAARMGRKSGAGSNTGAAAFEENMKAAIEAQAPQAQQTAGAPQTTQTVQAQQTTQAPTDEGFSVDPDRAREGRQDGPEGDQ